MSNLYAYIIVIAVLVAGVGGIFIGFSLQDPAAVPEDVTPAPGATQADGSVLVRRVVPPATPTKPPHQLPKGSKEERRVSLTLQPKKADCPPLRMDLSLVQIDGGRRIVASSPDGEVIASQDMPLVTGMIPPAPKRWAAGLSSDYDRERFGAWVDRDIGRVRIGAEVIEDRGDISGRVRLGVTW